MISPDGNGDGFSGTFNDGDGCGGTPIAPQGWWFTDGIGLDDDGWGDGWSGGDDGGGNSRPEP